MKFWQFSICKKDFHREGDTQDKDFFCVPNKFHLGMTPPRANKQEKEEICEKDLYLSVLKEL